MVDVFLSDPDRHFQAALGNIQQKSPDVTFEIIVLGQDRPEIRIGEAITIGLIEMETVSLPYSHMHEGQPCWTVLGLVTGHP